MVTGVTAKLWAASTVAFQGAVGEGAEGNNLRAHLDLLFCPGTWASSDGQYVLPVYLGIGGVLVHDFAVGQSPSATEGGFRVPLGMSVLVRGNPSSCSLKSHPSSRYGAMPPLVASMACIPMAPLVLAITLAGSPADSTALAASVDMVRQGNLEVFGTDSMCAMRKP